MTMGPLPDDDDNVVVSKDQQQRQHGKDSQWGPTRRDDNAARIDNDTDGIEASTEQMAHG